jgi:hypothetical protein
MRRPRLCSFLANQLFNIERHDAAVQPYIAAPREPPLQPSQQIAIRTGTGRAPRMEDPNNVAARLARQPA